MSRENDENRKKTYYRQKKHDVCFFPERIQQVDMCFWVSKQGSHPPDRNDIY